LHIHIHTPFSKWPLPLQLEKFSFTVPCSLEPFQTEDNGREAFPQNFIEEIYTINFLLNKYWSSQYYWRASDPSFISFIVRRKEFLSTFKKSAFWQLTRKPVKNFSQVLVSNFPPGFNLSSHLPPETFHFILSCCEKYNLIYCSNNILTVKTE